jgi:hypothetical protein
MWKFLAERQPKVFHTLGSEKDIFRHSEKLVCGLYRDVVRRLDRESGCFAKRNGDDLAYI